MVGVVAPLAFTVLAFAGPASAQPNPMYLPYQEGAAYTVTTGANQGHHAGSPYQRYDWDFGMPFGTPVLAAAPGVVQFAGSDGTGWGLSVSIRHPDGTTTIYAHLSEIAGGIARDAQVGQAQRIGNVGSTGNSTGPHLHFGVHNGSGLSGYSVPSSFTEAGVPATGGRPISRNRLTDNPPQFDDVRVYSSNTLDVTAGGPVRAVVTALYRGPVAIPCGYANLGVRGDGPARFADYSAGYWPNSPWRSASRIAAVNCNGDLDPGERAQWDLTFRPSEGTPSGTYLTGVYAPVHEGRAWSGLEIPISLRVTAKYAAKWVTQQGPAGPLAPGEKGTLKFVFKNTGVATLYKGGTNPTNCRASNPRDRSSVWVDPEGPGAVGRLGVAIDQDKVEPGATFSCTIPLKAPDRAGEYKEYFSPVTEGKAWLLERDDVWSPLTASGS